MTLGSNSYKNISLDGEKLTLVYHPSVSQIEADDSKEKMLLKLGAPLTKLRSSGENKIAFSCPIYFDNLDCSMRFIHTFFPFLAIATRKFITTSHRTNSDSELIRFGCEYATLLGKVHKKQVDINLRVAIANLQLIAWI